MSKSISILFSEARLEFSSYLNKDPEVSYSSTDADLSTIS